MCQDQLPDLTQFVGKFIRINWHPPGGRWWVYLAESLCPDEPQDCLRVQTLDAFGNPQGYPFKVRVVKRTDTGPFVFPMEIIHLS